MNLGLAKRTALVTLASRGLGLACAEALAAEGAEIILVARDQGRLEAAAARLSNHGTPVHTVAADFTTREGRVKVCEAGTACDIAVVLCPRSAHAHALEASEQQWSDTMSNGFWGPLEIMRQLVPRMRGRGFGRVVHIMGAGTLRPNAGAALTNAPRAALLAAISSLATELGGSGVTVNSVMPGPCDTSGLRANWQAQAQHHGQPTEAFRQAKLRAMPSGLARPDEIAALVAFLCGAPAGHVTGQVIVADGGATPGFP